MNKVVGVKSVDFRIVAEGHGVVNWQGSVPVRGPDGKEINNHSIPKIRGFTNKTGKTNEEGTYEYKVSAADIKSSEKNPVYVSRECVRNNLFKDESFNISTMSDKDDAKRMICSMVGLLKGYVIASGNTSINKKSPVLMESLTEVLHNSNFEQFSKFGSKQNDTSIFSKTTLGDTKYVGYGSLIIEDLFFPLDDVMGRKCCEVPTVEEGVEIAEKLTSFLKKLDFDGLKNPKATYNECYVRVGTIGPTGEAGIVLNEDAIDLVVKYLIEKLESLTIRQGGGHLSVTEVLVDYNDSNKHFRIKKDENSISSQKKYPYAVYYVEGTKDQVDSSSKSKEKQQSKKKK